MMGGRSVGVQCLVEPRRMTHALVSAAKNMTMATMATQTPVRVTSAGAAPPPEFQPSPPPPNSSPPGPRPDLPISFSGASCSLAGVINEVPMVKTLLRRERHYQATLALPGGGFNSRKP